MSERDIYAAPEAAVATEVARRGEAASRIWRLLAAIVDGILVAVCMVPFWILSVPASTIAGVSALPVGAQFLSIAYFAAVFLLINGYLLKKSGQTVGKYLLNIRIVSLSGSPVPLQTLVLYRYAPIWFVGMIPFLGQLLAIVDILFIFRADRRCIHDLLASTKVVDA